MARCVNAPFAEAPVFRIRHFLETLDADFVRDRMLPALDAARLSRPRRSGRLLAAVAREALPRLREALRRDEARAAARRSRRALDPEVGCGRLAVARLEALLACREPPTTVTAFEEVAWALVRAARLAPAFSLGEDWDLLHALLDPGRRRRGGMGALGGTLAAAAIVGSGPLASESGYALVRERSYATGWSSPEEVRRIARALGRARLSPRAVTAAVARGIYGSRSASIERRLPRAESALAKLRGCYARAAALGAGAFIELELV
jgi:hypothetical protein